MEAKTKLYSLPFWLLSASSFLFFASFNLLIPELPDFLRNLGGEDYIGLIIALFTVSAGLSRPFSGKITDQIGRIPVMIFGAGVCVLIGLLYPLVNAVLPFLLLRFFHGFSTGFKPTATVAYVGDIIPENKRGEALGVYGLIGSSGMALGPFLGSEIANKFGINTLFYVSALFALGSIIIILNLPETIEKKSKKAFNFSILKLKRNEIVDRNVFPAAIIVMLSYFSYGTLLTLSPDLSKTIGLENKGLFFSFSVVASLFIRIFAGRWSDKKGRIPILLYGVSLLCVALVILSITRTFGIFILAAVIHGIAMGLITPTSQAFTLDLSSLIHRGKGIATMFIALELGIGLGSFLPPLFFGNSLALSFLLAALAAFAAVVYLVYLRKKNFKDKTLFQR